MTAWRKPKTRGLLAFATRLTLRVWPGSSHGGAGSDAESAAARLGAVELQGRVGLGEV